MNYWYNEANIYHIYTFGLCNIDFNNDYSKTENKINIINQWIPHIKNMNFNTVCFSPVLKSKTHGYDTTDYFTIDNRIGTNEDFLKVVTSLKENNIKVMLDGVYNHCGRDFPYFKDLQENGENSKYIDWFSNVRFGEKNPLGDNFTYDTWDGYYELVKFNLKNPEVKNYLFESIKYLIDYYDIDGLRIDASNVLDLDFLSELRSFTTTLKHDFWLMGEVVHGDYNIWANETHLHSVTNYEVYKGLYSSLNEKNLFEIAYSLKRQFNTTDGIYKNLMLYNFVDNHDQSRIASILLNPKHLYIIYTLLYTVPGIPSVYYGSEWGITGKITNHSDKDVRGFIDINNIIPKEANLSETIKKLSLIKKESSALKFGDYKEISVTYEGLFAFERNVENEKIIILINISDELQTINLNNYSNNKFIDLLNNNEVIENSNNITLHPFWGRILKFYS